MEKKKINKKKIILIIWLIFVYFLMLLTKWVKNNFAEYNFEAILFQIKYPMVENVSNKIIFSFIKEVILTEILVVAIITIICIIIKHKNTDLSKYKKILFYFIIYFSLSGLAYFIVNLRIDSYIVKKLEVSTFIEDNYVDPKEVKVTFPKEKRNLIFIYLESIESAYAGLEDNGIMNKSLIPEIVTLEKNNINFSNTDTLGGMNFTVGSGFTVGSIVAQTSGLPLLTAMNGNLYGNFEYFMPNAYTLGEILEKEGYHQVFIMGSNKEYGGRGKYLSQHGNYEIIDYKYAKESGLYTGPREFWGFLDYALYDLAKDELTKLSSEDKPFNLSLLTIDTHNPDGIACKYCDTNENLPKDERYKRIISCASKQLSQFITWIKAQDFYDNTTIIFVGDHPTMSTTITDEYPDGYEKTSVCCIINPPEELKTSNFKEKYREYTSFDMYPTTLAAIGARIEGDRLGLGTNLFSSKSTLAEDFGLDYINNELMKSSRFYENKILKK
ncbi:MAG: LTA synthase family protein [Clostridia bacterium]|nr:LTA synthase family protein [Clostridia bacterium]